MPQPLVCTVRDQHRLRREFELLCAGAHDPQQQADELCTRFREMISRRPVDWSVERRRPSEHVWAFGGAEVRYRIVPDAEAVEIVSVTSPLG